MINIYSWSPYLFVYCAFIFQTLIVASYVWVPKGYQIPQTGFIHVIQRFFKNLFFAFYLLIGTTALHSAICWLLGQWTYNDWKFQLPAVLISLILGSQYVIATFFIKPTKLDVRFAVFVIVYVVSMTSWYIPDPSRMIENAVTFILIGVFLMILYPILKEMENKSVLRNGGNLNLMWNQSQKLYKIYNRPFNIIFWIIATIEAICKFEGTSLFIF